MNIEVPHLPVDDECKDGRFIHATGMKMFRGQKLPSHFRITVSDTDKLSEGQEIGRTRFGQVIYWINNQVVVKG